jgi:hypothetical protein
MSAEPALQAFQRLLEQLPPGTHLLRTDYAVPGKLSLQRAKAATRLVLSWRSNGYLNELTTRAEYADALRRWFPELKSERAKPHYFSQRMASPEALLELVTAHGQAIALAIRRCQD